MTNQRDWKAEIADCREASDVIGLAYEAADEIERLHQRLQSETTITTRHREPLGGGLMECSAVKPSDGGEKI
jgi:hypothetical protein